MLIKDYYDQNYTEKLNIITYGLHNHLPDYSKADMEKA